MNRISKEDILAFEHWERVRNVLRPLFIHEKERRRLAVGSHLTFLFENTATLWYQVEEMLRSERISDPQAIQHEIDTYNELIPTPNELSATLLIEFPDEKERDAALRRLLGLEKHLWLRVGDQRSAVKFDERQMTTDRISSVQFVRLPVPASADAFLEHAMSGRVAIEADHPNLAAQARIEGVLARALTEDLGSPDTPQ